MGRGQGARRRRCRDIGDDEGTQRSPTTPISPKGGGATASISLSLLPRDAHDIASSSLRELDAVALATNVTEFMKRGTKSEAEKAIQNLDGTELEGRTIKVHVARPRLV